MPLAYKKQTYTVETGEQTLYDVSPKDDVSVGLEMGSGDVVRIEAVLTKSGTRYPARSEDVTETGVYSVTGPIFSIGVNIITNATNDIKAEFFTSHRFG